MARRKYTLDQILDYTRAEGPRVVKRLGVILQIGEAESLVEILEGEGFSIDVYDFPAIRKVWQSARPDGVSYRHHATKQLIQTLAQKRGLDYKTFEGFRQLLPELKAVTFRQTPINDLGTTLQGMLHVYKSSPSAAVLDLVMNDDEFSEIRDKNLQPYDFPNVPQNTWMDKEGIPTQTARQATKQLIKTLAEQKGVDYKTFEGFRQLLPELTKNTFQQTQINEWGTKLGSMLYVYNHSPYAAIIDLIKNDDEFEEIRKRNLQPYDFLEAPQNTWMDKEGKPTQTARQATKQLIKTMAEVRGVDYKTFFGFRQLLPLLAKDDFKYMSINEWGTTLAGMLQHAYNDSPSAAVLDLVMTDPEFIEIRNRNLQPYDFLPAPHNTWIDQKGKPTQVARQATKQLLMTLAERKGVDYKTFKGFKQILPYLTAKTFSRTPINEWRTTLGGMLDSYNNIPSAAVLDLISIDDDFKDLRGIVTTEMLTAPVRTRVALAEVLYSDPTATNIELYQGNSVTYEGKVKSVENLYANDIFRGYQIVLEGIPTELVLSYRYTGKNEDNALQLGRKLSQMEGQHVVVGGRFVRKPVFGDSRVNVSYIGTEDFYAIVNHRKFGSLVMGNEPDKIIQPHFK